MQDRPEKNFEKTKNGVVWTSPDGERHEYLHEYLSELRLEVQEIRRHHNTSWYLGLDKPMRSVFSGKASLTGSVQLIGIPDSKSHSASVRFYEYDEKQLAGIYANYGEVFSKPEHLNDAHNYVHIGYEKNEWYIEVHLPTIHFQALSDAFDKSQVARISAGIRSNVLFLEGRVARECQYGDRANFSGYNMYMQPDPDWHDNITLGGLFYFSFGSPLQDLTQALPANYTIQSDSYRLDSGIDSEFIPIIERQFNTRFGPENDEERLQNKVAYFAYNVRSKQVWLSKTLAFGIARQVSNHIKATHGTSIEFELRLEEALALLEEVQSALNPVGSKERSNWSSTEEYRKRLTEFEQNCDHKAWVWHHLDVSAAIQGGKDVRDYWPVSTKILSDLCFEYLKRPWMEHPAFEFLMVDALIYQRALELGVELWRRRWHWWMPEVAALLRFFLAVVVCFGVAIIYGVWPGVLAGAAVGLLNIRYRGTDVQGEDHKKLQELISVSNLFSDSRISPEFVKQRLLAIADKGVVWPVGAIALVEHAAKRNPVTWVP